MHVGDVGRHFGHRLLSGKRSQGSVDVASWSITAVFCLDINFSSDVPRPLARRRQLSQSPPCPGCTQGFGFPKLPTLNPQTPQLGLTPETPKPLSPKPNP